MTTRSSRCVVTLLPGLLLACLVPFLTGCIGVMPVPALPNKVTHGSRITSDKVAFIKPGKTTRAEVVAMLGTNCLAAPHQRALAYSWEVKGGGGVWWVCLVEPTYGSHIVDGGGWTGGWRAFFVAFDDEGVVKATAFKYPSTRKSLHQHLDKWLAGLPAKAREGPSQMMAARSSPD